MRNHCPSFDLMAFVVEGFVSLPEQLYHFIFYSSMQKDFIDSTFMQNSALWGRKP